MKNLSKTFGDLLEDLSSPLIRGVGHKGLLGGIEIETDIGVNGPDVASALV